VSQQCLIPIKRGDLVRYEENTVRWYFALARRVDVDSIEVEYFWGERERVPTERVRTIDDYLRSRQRVLSLSRTALLNSWFGESFERLTEIRRSQIQKTLRKHGISFSDDGWSTSAGVIQLRRDDSVVLGKLTATDYQIESLVPHWVAPPNMPPSSRDPLGLQSYAEHLANEMLPGLTVFTFRAGYYGFLSWAINCANERTLSQGQTRRDMINRLERALVLCEFIQHGQGDESCALLGQRSKRRILQSAANDRFDLPDRILQNQNSAGAFRLHSTSLVSFGFASADSELALSGDLPLSLTEDGRRLAAAFARWVPDGLADFAFGRASRAREELRKWGSRICFSHVARGGRNGFRDNLLRGLLFADSEDGEKRYRTVKALLGRGLIGSIDAERGGIGREPHPLISEGDGDGAESLADTPQGGLTNSEVLLQFYSEQSTVENRVFQVAAVYELLALGLSCMFGSLLDVLKKSGKVSPVKLADQLAGSGRYSGIWTASAPSRLPRVAALVEALYEEEEPALLGQLGGALVERVLRDPVFASVGSEISDHPLYFLIEPMLPKPGRQCLAKLFPALAELMLCRHEQVSQNKNKQRWFFSEGAEFARDDLQDMGIGFHAMRFPQLYRLCDDIGLTREDLSYGV